MATKDPYIEALLDRAIAPYAGKLSPAAVEEIREALGDALATHPVVSKLVERGRPHEGVLQSDEHERGAAPDEQGGTSQKPASPGQALPIERGRRRG